jgi:ketosteroid isomerase-like protein
LPAAPGAARGTPREPDLSRQREVVEAYLAALRKGDLAALLTILDPEVVIRADRAALPDHLPSEVHGAQSAAKQALQLARGAKAARVALVDGEVGVIVAPRGRLYVVLALTIQAGKISAIDVIADGARLQALELHVLDDLSP